MPKIIGSNLEEHRERTRQALFDALAHLLKERSFDDITMSDIATTAKIGRTSIYNHYRDKDDILVAFLTEELERYTAAVEKQLESTTNPIVQLRIYIRAEILADRPYLNTSNGSLAELPPRARSERLGSVLERSSDRLAQTLQLAMDERAIPQRDVSLLTNIVTHALSPRDTPCDQAELERYISELELFIFRGIGYRGAANLSSSKFTMPQLDYVPR